MTYFFLCLIFFVALILIHPSTAAHCEDAYKTPNYTFSEGPDGKLFIDVSLEKQLKEKIDAVREPLITAEAKKDPLFAIALIQKLAQEGDLPCQKIRRLYQSWRHFLVDGNRKKLLEEAEKILIDSSLDSLTRRLTASLKAFLLHTPQELSLKETGALLNALLPNIEHTLSIPRPTIRSEEKIEWSGPSARYKAFPDIIKYEGFYYVCFREGKSHVGYNDLGSIRILKGIFHDDTSRWTWNTIGLLSQEGYDLRDPKFFLSPNKSLHLIIGGSILNEKGETIMMVPHVARFNGQQFQLEKAHVDQSAQGPHGQWIWRVTQNPSDKKGYALSYGKGTSLSLMRTADGVTFDAIAEISSKPLKDLSEGTLRFTENGKAFALIRCGKTTIIGTASPEQGYTQWSLQTIPLRVGGPNCILTKGFQGWAATRYYFLQPDNSLDEALLVAYIDEKTMTPILQLRSGLDVGYPGIILEENGSLTLTYYVSESEESSTIYITKIQ